MLNKIWKDQEMEANAYERWCLWICLSKASSVKILVDSECKSQDMYDGADQFDCSCPIALLGRTER